MRPALQKSGQVWVRTPGTSKRGIPREIAEIAKVMSGVLDSLPGQNLTELRRAASRSQLGQFAP